MKHLHTLLLRITLLSTLLLTSCSGTNDGLDEEVRELASISVAQATPKKGNGKITFFGEVGTPWSATIVEGDDFVSFDLHTDESSKSGAIKTAAPLPNILYFYYDQNEGEADREAVIEFSLDGGAPIRLSFKQLSEASFSNPYAGAESKTPRWNEIPAKVENSNYIYVTHTAELQGQEVRNYSICFDKRNLASAWVAYPYHKAYAGSVGRVEDWAYDPKIPSQYQPATAWGSYSGNYDRGHQMASADRQATNELNRQTFYATNMTPQYANLNRYEWAELEGDVRNQVCSDTLYVVTGADFTTTIGSTKDKDGKVCPLPGAYYKVLLRTKRGNSGKAISECSASELQAVGFWMEHRAYDAVPSPVSVKFIEDKTGFDFFPSVPDEVKASFSASDWHF